MSNLRTRFVSAAVVVPSLFAGNVFAQESNKIQQIRDWAATVVRGDAGTMSSLNCAVRRVKVLIFSGATSTVNPTRLLVVPAGSNWSGGGGNETVEASGAKGRAGDSASQQAVT